MLKGWLAHPLTRDLDIDDPRTTERRRAIVQQNRFLHNVYEEWYAAIAAAIPSGEGAVLELGSGAGFLRQVIPDLIPSEVFYSPHVHVVLDGQQMPMADSSLRAIVMTDVFHHIANPRHLLKEACRCVRKDGVLCMIEPWVSAWSSLIYSRLHHELFLPKAEWGFPSQGPLSGANGAQPWIVFERDGKQFEREFPEWRIQKVEPMMPFRYLVSGGVSLRPLAPAWSFGFWRGVENALRPWMRSWAMFALIVLRRQ